MIKWMTIISKLIMYHFKETETQWTDRGPWAFYLKYACNMLGLYILILLNYCLQKHAFWHLNHAFLAFKSILYLVRRRKYYKTDILMAAIFNLCINKFPQG